MVMVMVMVMVVVVVVMVMVMVMVVIMWTLPSVKVDSPLCKVYFTLAGLLSPLSPLSWGWPSPQWATFPSLVDFALVQGRLSPRVLTVVITMCILRFILVASSLGNVIE